MNDNNCIEILLVEDNPLDEELAFHALHKSKLINPIHVVRDGVEALDFIFAREQFSNRQIDHPPKVVLLDLKLPKLDGLEVLRQIKEDPRTRSIPVVMLTSSQLEQDIIKSYELGVNSFITKPINYHQFSETIVQIGSYWTVLNKTL